MAATNSSLEVAPRVVVPTASRKSISSQAASASRALTSAASTSFSSPYSGLPSPSSSSSSVSLAQRRSSIAAGKCVTSTYPTASPSTASLVRDHTNVRPSQRSGSSSTARHHDVNTASNTRCSSKRSSQETQTSQTDAVKPAVYPTSHRLQRHHSDQSLRLDLDGLDLGGNQRNTLPSSDASFPRHTRSQSNVSGTSPLAHAQQSYTGPAYNAVVFDVDPFGNALVTQDSTHAINGVEDSFSLHLREECSDYRQIVSSQVILNAAIDKEHRLQNPNLNLPEAQRQRGYSVSHGQVLGGFASLGMQTEPEEPAPARIQPARTASKASTVSSQAPITPIEWRDSFGTTSAPTPTPPPKWAHLASRPCNPLEPLDVLSIQEMGFHSLDMGSLNDWDGCKLSAEILCPINGHQRIEWLVAQTTRKTKKWVVVPNATVTCGQADALSTDLQAERTVIVSERSLYLDDSTAQSAKASSSSANPSPQPSPGLPSPASTLRRITPFSGQAGFELCLLRPTVGRICLPIYLANASTHRQLHQFRQENTPLSLLQASGFVAASANQPIYPVLRRSRSRPYMRQSHVPLRRSRSKPYLKLSAAEQLVSGSSSSHGNAEEFAPSLPGDPLPGSHTSEAWPSARSPLADLLSSFESMGNSDVDSETSSDELEFTVSRNRASSTSYDPSAKRLEESDGEQGRSRAVPMNVAGSRSGNARRALSPGSSASRNLSSASEASGSYGWNQYPQQQLSESESWHGTSPTTASASSTSATSKTSKTSRSRKGLQRALQKKDKMISSWFKRKPENGLAPAASPGTVREMPRGSPSTFGNVQQVSSNAGSTPGRENVVKPAMSGIAGSTPLTETTLESFQKAMFRPSSPDSTIMGSRRGSEALTQKTVESGTAAADRASQDKSAKLADSVNAAAAGADSQNRLEAADHRKAVGSTLSQIYGWNQQQSADKTVRPTTRMSNGSVLSTPSTAFQDMDERVALLGIDAVPSGALTMLIPLPVIGRNKAQDAVRYMRVNFVPFGNFPDAENPRNSVGPGLPNGGLASSESESGVAQSASSGNGSLGVNRETPASNKSAEQSKWKRKLGLSSGASRTANGASPGAASETSTNGPKPEEVPPVSPPPSAGMEAFRITAVVHDAPWIASFGGDIDPRLPEPGTFPVVLGYCNGSKGLDMVPEGWGALKLAGVAEPTKEDGSPLDGRSPLKGVVDLIIAACTAVMDV